MPPALRELQRGFARALAGESGGLEPWIAGRGIAPTARLAIYRHAHLAIHAEALATSFPAVRAWLGEAAFDGFATRHAAQIGSRSGNLQAYGADFPGFLAGQPELAALPQLAELAALEWQRQCCVLAAPAVPVDAATLARALLGSADPVVRLQPHVRLHGSTAPVLDLWRRAFEPSLPPGSGPQQVLLWREGGAVAMRAVAPPLAAFLGALRDGRPLGVAFALAQTASTGAPVAVEALLSPLLEHALIATIVP